MTKRPPAASCSQNAVSQAISWAVKPITSNSAGSSDEPNVSYSISMLPGLVVATEARGIAAVSRTGLRSDDMTGTRVAVHTGLQHTTPDELSVLWQRIEALGF